GDSADADNRAIQIAAARVSVHIGCAEGRRSRHWGVRPAHTKEVRMNNAKVLAGTIPLPEPIIGLDRDHLRAAIQEEYAEVAAHPDRGFHFNTGRPLAHILDYSDAWLAGIPEGAIASFAGTGNPFRLGALHVGEHVVDVGCGAGIDSLIAARMVGPGGSVVGVDMTPAM